MNREQLEFAISQYVDGTLPGPERLRLDIRLNQDSEARRMLKEYEAFDATLRAAKSDLPLPDVKWDALAEQISDAVARADVGSETGVEDESDSAVIGRIGWRISPRWMALAASVLIAAGVTFQIVRSRTQTKPVGPGTSVAKVDPFVIQVIDAEETVKSNSPIVVAIGPSDAADGAGPDLWRYADDVLSRTSHVVIASSNPPVQDTTPSVGFPF